jgi:phosphopantothenoylcysteine decarboxylase/phosphopantothenate--cysteine ligase
MLEAVKKEIIYSDIVIKAAAPSDYRTEEKFPQKIKEERFSLNLVKNPDIAKYVGQHKNGKILVVFAAETNDLLKNASAKLKEKNADMIVANDVTKEGAGFGSDTNIATIIRKDGVMTSYEMMPKRELADLILDNILEIS